MSDDQDQDDIAKAESAGRQESEAGHEKPGGGLTDTAQEQAARERGFDQHEAAKKEDDKD